MRLTAAIAVLALAACPPPSAEEWTFGDSPSDGSSGGSTGGAGSTGEVGAESSGGGSTGTVEETGTGEPEPTGEEPAVLPDILYVALNPDPIEAAGPITVEVHTAHADRVEMMVDGATPVLLEQEAPGTFVGEIPVVSWLDNGPHTANFTPWRADLAGKPVGRSFDAELPKGGSEARWEVSSDLSEALGDAIVVGPNGEFYEFGTLDPGGDPRCFLRQRGPKGEYGLDDVIAPVLVDTYCMAKEVALAPDGGVLLLAEVKKDGMKRWWLGRMASWDSPVENVAWGALEEVAAGLAVDQDGRAAVCGTVNTSFGDRDAFFAMPGELSRTFDFKYKPLDDPGHQFGEVVHDCVFVQDVLVVAGELWGKHPNELPMDWARHMVFEVDTQTEEAVWNIAAKGPGQYVQSGARAIARDGDGYVTAGYVCEEQCVAQLQLRQFLAGAESVDDFMPAMKPTVATDIARSPAGYVVVTGALIQDAWWTDFLVQAWMPGDPQELWTYARSDAKTTHIAQGVAIGEYGRVYAIGVAQQLGVNRPVIALLNP